METIIKTFRIVIRISVEVSTGLVKLTTIKLNSYSSLFQSEVHSTAFHSIFVRLIAQLLWSSSVIVCYESRDL